MAANQKNHIVWGRPRDFLITIAILLVIGVGAAIHWHALDLGYAIVVLAFYLAGSIIVLWRAWRHRNEPGPARLGQLAALPASWRKWVLGESSKDVNK